MLNYKLLLHLKRLQKKAIQKTAEATGDLIGNKIADKITKVSNTLPQNSSQTVINRKTNLEKDIYLQMKDRKI